MHRIDHSTAVGSQPAPDAAGTPGFFTKGDPQIPVPATVVTADWANAQQEELAFVIEQAGLSLSKTDNTQLRQAIVAIIGQLSLAVIDRDVTQAEVVNTAAETTIYSFSVPGGTLGLDRALRLTLLADYLNNSGVVQNFTVRVKFGTTTIGTFSASGDIPVDTNRRIFKLVTDVSAANATNAQRAITECQLSTPNALTAQSADAFEHKLSMHNSSAVDSTLVQVLEVTVQHVNANANISFRALTVQLEAL